MLRRVADEMPIPMPPSEIEAWSRLSGIELRPSEFAYLVEMDRAFCNMTGKELQDYAARREDKAKAQRGK